MMPCIKSVLMFAFVASCSMLTMAQPPETDARGLRRVGPHQGSLQTVSEMQIETVIDHDGVRVYVYSSDGQPVSIERARGVARISAKGRAKRYRYDLTLTQDGAMRFDIDFSQISGRQIMVDFQLQGIGPQIIAFQEVGVAPADQDQKDAVAIARQSVCVVSGRPLGSMGTPIAVDAVGQLVFVCCAECVNAVQDDPASYVRSKPVVELVTTTKADAAMIAKQGKCPVMDEPLGSMGQPVKLLVGGKPMFLCCKGCIKKVQAEPDKYLAMISDSPNSVVAGTEQVRPGVFKVGPEDKAFIRAQKTCPVMDEPLDAMGGPYKVHAKGKAIYICCPGCAKQITADPAKWLKQLKTRGVKPPTILTKSPTSKTVPAGSEAVRPGVFKVAKEDAAFVAAQSLCPVMDEPLDAMGGPYKVHVKGKAVYICCPGCAKRIEAEPDKYLDSLAEKGVSPPAIR